MKCVFLDIDGVFNCEEFFADKKHRQLELSEPWPINTLDPDRIKLFNTFVEETDAEIVLSSTWRLTKSINEMNDIFNNKGLNKKILDKTPQIPIPKYNTITPRNLYERGMEIDYWLTFLAPCDITSFVIFDDDSDLNPHMDKLVKTSWLTGLQPKHLKMAKEILNNQERKSNL